jgi:hypothetical protein
VTRGGRRRKDTAARAGWGRALTVLRRHRASLLRRSGVVAVDVGLRLRKRRITREVAIRVHVIEKVPDADLSASRRFPRSLEGVPVDVIEARYRALECPFRSTPLRIRRDVLEGGLALAANPGSFGTLAAIAKDGAGDVFALTCAHLVTGAVGASIGQPGPEDPIGTVERARLDSRMDAALVRLDGSRGTAPGIRGIGPLGPVLDVRVPGALPVTGLPIRIVGACSGRSRGRVTGLHASARVEYPTGPITLRDQLHILADNPDGEEFSREGDSGALVVTQAGQRPVGLLFAGEAAGSGDFGLATPIVPVLGALGVEFLGATT